MEKFSATCCYINVVDQKVTVFVEHQPGLAGLVFHQIMAKELFLILAVALNWRARVMADGELWLSGIPDKFRQCFILWKVRLLPNESNSTQFLVLAHFDMSLYPPHSRFLVSVYLCLLVLYLLCLTSTLPSCSNNIPYTGYTCGHGTACSAGWWLAVTVAALLPSWKHEL